LIQNVISTILDSHPRRPIIAFLVPFLLAAAIASSLASAADLPSRRWPDKAATPPLALVDQDGRAVTLDSLRGKVVILNFWASWCGPCIDELPVLNDLADSAAAQGKVVVLGVNYKESPAIIQRFTAEHAFRYSVVMDRTGDAFKGWTGGVLPATILIDRGGRPRWRVIGELDRNDKGFKQALERALEP
jgi:cytochrome c biogenesis protein CcmG/thiol:disulfide interchange protein DsbE